MGNGRGEGDEEGNSRGGVSKYGGCGRGIGGIGGGKMRGML